MSWCWGSVAVLMYSTENSVVALNFLLLTDNTPLLLTDMTGILLAGS